MVSDPTPCHLHQLRIEEIHDRRVEGPTIRITLDGGAVVGLFHLTESAATGPVGSLQRDLAWNPGCSAGDGVRHSGKALNAVRHRHRELRRRLQAKKTTSAKRLRLLGLRARGQEEPARPGRLHLYVVRLR
ncbi:hypothetical protein [Nonomuraea sp. NPDC048916]|uniref:hypothetical protein n=1 Tax=Nonomuraea sp. NPDC048916 TaxID=3154232 RepID=UPI0033ECF67C